MYRIRKLGEADFTLFKEVFSVFEEEPFYEAWTFNDYDEEFDDFLNSGAMYGIFDDNVILGLITIKPKYLKWDKLDIDIEKSIYLSDIAVRSEFRNQGIGSILMKYIVDLFGSDFDIYMRTNLTNSMSEGIALRNDFEVIEGLIELVSFARTRDDIPNEDERKYLIRRRK